MSEPEWFRRDCQCVGHVGPHWLHMQLMDRAALKRLADESNMTPALAHHIASEAARLEGELAATMERQGIDVLRGDLVARVRRSHAEWVERHKEKREAGRRQQHKRDEERLADMAAEYETATAQRRREIERESVKLQRSWWSVPVVEEP